MKPELGSFVPMLTLRDVHSVMSVFPWNKHGMREISFACGGMVSSHPSNFLEDLPQRQSTRHFGKLHTGGKNGGECIETLLPCVREHR